MPKEKGDLKKAPVRSIAEIAHDMALRVAKKDERHNYFWNYVPVPKLMGPDGYFRTTKQTAVVCGANRCISGDMRIWDPELKDFRVVGETTSDFSVLAWNGESLVSSRALKPFVKSFDNMMEVIFSNGQKLLCTRDHLILGTRLVYQPLATMKVGDCVFQPESSLDIFQQVHNSSDRHYSRRVPSSPICCRNDSYFCDGQPLQEEEIFSDDFPLQAYATRHNILDGNKPSYLSSSFRSDARRSDARARTLLHNPSESQQFHQSTACGNVQVLGRSCYYDECPSIRDVFLDNSFLRLFYELSTTGSCFAPTISRCFPCNDLNLSSASRSFIPPLVLTDDHATTITSIRNLGKQKVWDFEVPYYHNYFAGGVVNHNSTKTTAAVFKHIMIYTGIIPPSMCGVYGHEKILRDISPGGKHHRPRGVRIVVMDYTSHWPLVIRPMLLGDPAQGAKGMLPETWSEYNPEEHTFYGPDGSYLNIFAANPHESTFPYGLRGLELDATLIDEINRYSVYTESLVRGGALKYSMKTVDLSFCPQHGYECYTYKKFFMKTHDPKTLKPLPKEKTAENISMTLIGMRDNPSLSAEQIKKFVDDMEPWEVAFRVDGHYSQRAENPFFNMDMLVDWQSEERCTVGTPYRVVEDKIDEEAGTFEGHLEKLERGNYDEREDMIWWFWEMPQDGHKYVISADPALGHVDGDPHAVGVWDATMQELPRQVGQYRSRVGRPGDLAIQAACVGNVFGGLKRYALVVPEINSTGGGAFVERIRNYRTLYTRIRIGRQEEKETEELGYNLDVHNKGPALSDAYKMLRVMYNTQIVENGVKRSFCPIRSEITLGEMMSFQERVVRKKMAGAIEEYGPVARVEWGARTGAHDDTVDEMVMAFRIIKHEYHKISACVIKSKLVEIYHSKLEEDAQKQKQGHRAFSGMRKQPSLMNLRRAMVRRSKNGR